MNLHSQSVDSTFDQFLNRETGKERGFKARPSAESSRVERTES